MITRRYTLPDWEFIGGTTQPYEFKLKTEDGHVYDIEGATASIVVAPFVNPDDVIYTSDPFDITASDEDNGSFCVVGFKLPTEKTINWRGKYIYQIIVETKDDDKNDVVAVQQGRLFVHKNLKNSGVM